MGISLVEYDRDGDIIHLIRWEIPRIDMITPTNAYIDALRDTQVYVCVNTLFMHVRISEMKLPMCTLIVTRNGCTLK